MQKFRTLLMLMLCALPALARNTYTNPIVYQDYSDPDVIRVGETYWMTASSFHCSPGLPILRSYDLVHWEVVSYALPKGIPGGVGGLRVEHGNQVWAPSIRHHDGLFYITWGDPDVGIYQVHAEDPLGPWSDPHLIVAAKGYIDACPFWDEDGRTYIVHALARSRCGMKSLLLITEVDRYLTHILSPSEVIFDGHATQPTCEGPKMYKRDGWYYIFFPAGGVATGWQTVIRSRDVHDGWKERIVMQQGISPVNGPHQGGWVTTPSGEDWFIHFQDVGALGRILHLQPIQWGADGWPVIGVDWKGEGVGVPVLYNEAPTVSAAQKQLIKQSKKVRRGYHAAGLSAELKDWQWQAVPSDKDAELLVRNTLLAAPRVSEILWEEPHMVLRKIEGPDAEYTAQVVFRPMEEGDRCGFVIMGKAYAGWELKAKANGEVALQYVQNDKAEKGGAQQTTLQPLQQGATARKTADNTMPEVTLFLRIRIHSEDALPEQGNDDKRVTATFAYSTDGKHFVEAEGQPVFTIEPGKWIGAKIGFYCTSSGESDGSMQILSFERK